MLHGAGVHRGAQIELIVHQQIGDIAVIPTRAADQIIADRCRCRARRSRGRHVAGQAEGALRRPDDRQLLHVLPARQIAQRDAIGELMFEDQRRAVDRDVLRIDVAIAEVIGAIDAGQRAVVEGVLVIRHAILRDIVVFLVEVMDGQPGIAVEAERRGRRDAPALVILDVAAGHVIVVRHGVEAQTDRVAGAHVGIDGGAIIIIGADPAIDPDRRLALRIFGDEVDRSADRACARIDRIGTVHDLDLFEDERIAARILPAVAHVIDSDVARRRIAAQRDLVRRCHSALRRAEGDAGHGRQHVAQGEQILLLDRLVG